MNVIDKAADRLRGRWLQGRATDDEGRVCAIAAIYLSAPGEDLLASMAVGILRSVITEEMGDQRGVAPFNDDPATTEEDVLLLFKKASARYDEIHGATS